MSMWYVNVYFLMIDASMPNPTHRASKFPLSDDPLLNISMLYRVVGQIRELSFGMFSSLSLLETQTKIRIWHFSSDILTYCHSPTLGGVVQWNFKEMWTPLNYCTFNGEKKTHHAAPCWHRIQPKTCTVQLRPWGGEGRRSSLCFQTHMVEFHLDRGLVLHSLPRGLSQQTVNMCLSWTVSTHIANFSACAKHNLGYGGALCLKSKNE